MNSTPLPKDLTSALVSPSSSKNHTIRIVGLLAMGLFTVSSLFTILAKPQAFASLFNANRDLAMNSDLLMVGAKLKEPISGPISSPISGPIKRVPKPKVTEFIVNPTKIPEPGPLTGTVVPLVTATITPTQGVKPTVSKRVFLTSTSYVGNLGGLAGADLKCQQSADKSSLGGVWKAWLSDDTTSATSRMSKTNAFYNRIDKVLVAQGWNDLVDGSLLSPINVTEKNATMNVSWVWTNSTATGEIRQATGNSCDNWSANGSGGSTGDSSRVDTGWSDFGASACYISRPLYCIEQ